MPFKKPQPFATSVQQCVICLEDLVFSRHFLTRRPTNTCKHASTICYGCMRCFVHEKVLSTRTTDIRCAAPGCTELLQYGDVKCYAKKEVFEQFDRLLLQKTLGNEKFFVMCKNVNCTSGQYHDGENSNIVTCYKCGSKSCFTHEMPWHEGMSCREYDDAEAKLETAADTIYLLLQTKQCPKCRVHIEKNDGCDLMTCLACRHKFCWSCLVSYRDIDRDGNHRHQLKCPHYRAIDLNGIQHFGGGLPQ